LPAKQGILFFRDEFAVDSLLQGRVCEPSVPGSAAACVSEVRLVIYFVCAAESQKAGNIERNGKVSLTITLPYFSWEEIRGLSMGGRAAPVTDPKEVNRVSELMLHKFPQILRYAVAGKKGVFLIRITPEVISVLDYRKGFGHTDLIKL